MVYGILLYLISTITEYNYWLTFPLIILRAPIRPTLTPDYSAPTRALLLFTYLIYTINITLFITIHGCLQVFGRTLEKEAK